jgi:acyl-coenzyme A thioesterase PaaI-like protein
MGKAISQDYQLARRTMTGTTDPSGYEMTFEREGDRVVSFLNAVGTLVGKAMVLPAGPMGGIVEETGHAAVAALRRRVGVTREYKVRSLKPLYAKEKFRVEGRIVAEQGELFTVQTRVYNHKEQLCFEGETDVFALAAEQYRRMTQDGMISHDLRRYFP